MSDSCPHCSSPFTSQMGHDSPAGRYCRRCNQYEGFPRAGAPITATALNGGPVSRNDCRILAAAARAGSPITSGDTGRVHGPEPLPEITPDRTIIVPAQYMGQIDAELLIDSPDGETATIALHVAGRELARGETFRRPESGPYTWHDAPESEVCATFGAFLTHAFESREPDAREGWPILTDGASDWCDALTLAGEPV
jgi:hypothetical protein